MQETAIRIGSYNVRKARGLDQRRNPERTLAVINTLEADLVVLQEADKRLGRRPTAIPRDLIEAETDFAPVEVAANDASIGWHGNAVLVRKGLPVDVLDRLNLPGLEPRGAVRIRVKGLDVVATHLGLRRKDRRAQLQVIRTALSDDAPCIIAGDFNEWSATRGFEPLADRFQVHSPGRSFHARRPIAGLDRFALSRGLKLQDAGVKEGPLARVASDHLPIWSDIRLPTELPAEKNRHPLVPALPAAVPRGG